jgi:hypothetical protein
VTDQRKSFHTRTGSLLRAGTPPWVGQVLPESGQHASVLDPDRLKRARSKAEQLQNGRRDLGCLHPRTYEVAVPDARPGQERLA